MLMLLLQFAHLLGASLALGEIVVTDLRLLRRLASGRTRIAPPRPHVIRLMTISLIVLYATGGALISLGLAADPTYLSDNPKLLGKLVLVALLTINALVLHRITFPTLARGRRLARWTARDFASVAVPVAVSNCLWFYCAFLGIARPWSRNVSMEFVLGTALWLFGAGLVGLLAVLLIAARGRVGALPAASRI